MAPVSLTAIDNAYHATTKAHLDLMLRIDPQTLENTSATLHALWRGGIEILVRVTRIDERPDVLKIAVSFPRSNEGSVPNEVKEGLASNLAAFLKANGWDALDEKIEYASQEFRLIASVPGAEMS